MSMKSLGCLMKPKKKRRNGNRDCGDAMLCGNDKRYIADFLAEIWCMLTPEMIERLKMMLIEEFSMTPQEAEDFIRCQRDKAMDKRKGTRYKCNITCLGMRHMWIKEFTHMLSQKLTNYVINMLCLKRTPRVRMLAGFILQNLNEMLGEEASLTNPKTRVQKIMVMFADRCALFLDGLLTDAEKRALDYAREMEKLCKKDEEEEEEPPSKEPTISLQRTKGSRDSGRPPSTPPSTKSASHKTGASGTPSKVESGPGGSPTRSPSPGSAAPASEPPAESEKGSSPVKEEASEAAETASQTSTRRSKSKSTMSSRSVVTRTSMASRKTGMSEKSVEAGPEKADAEVECSDEARRELMDRICQWIETLEDSPCPSERQKLICSIVRDRLLCELTNAGLMTEEAKICVKLVSQKVANWIDRLAAEVEAEVGFDVRRSGAALSGAKMKQKDPCAQIVCDRRASKSVYHLKRGSGNYYDVQKMSEMAAAEKTARARGRPVPVWTQNLNYKPLTMCPPNPRETRKWADWAQDASKVASQWAGWIDSTVEEAECLSKRKKGDGPELTPEEWRCWQEETHQQATDWRKSKRTINETAAIWDQKMKGSDRRNSCYDD